jgi:hypothetical protein
VGLRLHNFILTLNSPVFSIRKSQAFSLRSFTHSDRANFLGTMRLSDSLLAMKSILSRAAIATIVPALLIAAAPVTAKPVLKAPTIVKAQDAIAQSNPKNKAPKKNAKIEALRSAIYDYYAAQNQRSEPGPNVSTGGFGFVEIVRLDLQSFKGDRAEVAAILLDRSYGGARYGNETTFRYEASGMITRNIVIKLEKKGNQWKVDDVQETSNDWQSQNKGR